MREIEYDEDKVLTAYLIKHASHFMSDFERQCVRLGIIREKASASGNPSMIAVYKKKWDQEANCEIEAALSNGVMEFQTQIQKRLLSEYGEGKLLVNRCPECNRIVRSPKAMQCLWCGHDWHKQ